MELTIFERLTLLNALPESGDLTTIRIVRKLREALSLNEAEYKEHKVATLPDGRVKWEGDHEYTIELGAKAREIAVKALEKLDKDGKVEDRHITLFDKFAIGLD